MAVVNRYSDTIRGALTYTGNTLGLAGNTGASPGTADTIGGLVTIDPDVPTSPGWGAVVNLSENENITQDWMLNSSSAELVILPGSTITHAELLWGGSAITGGNNVSANLGDPINFTLPDNTVQSISPDPATSATIPVGATTGYVNSANVTDLVRAQLGGTYTAGKVPIAQPSATAWAGWALLVAYENDSLPFRNLNIYVTSEAIGTGSGVDIPITGFATPESGPVNARFLSVAGEGDPQTTGDSARLGPTTANLTALSGPRNPANNFFDSQITDDSGNLDTTGTFGDRNSNPGSVSFAARQGWDINNVDASNAFVNNQTSAVVRISTGGDGFVLNSVGLQIDVNEASIVPIKSTDRPFSVVGDTITYTIVLDNTGTTTANTVVFSDTIPNDTTFVPNSLTVNGNSQPGENPESGINIGSIGLNDVVTITFQVTVDTIPDPNPIPNTGFVSYNFIPGTGLDTIPDSNAGNTVFTSVEMVDVSITKGVNKNFAGVGDTITYTIILENNGTLDTQNLVVTDTIPNDTTFIPNSVTINGTSSTDNPESGINISGLSIEEVITITFDVLVNTLPDPNPIPNNSTINYNYIVDPSGPTSLSGSNNSNEVTTQVGIAIIDTIKNVDKIFASCSDILTYTISIPNTGNIDAINVVLSDTIPNSTTFITDSITINGVPQIGGTIDNINVGTIPAGGISTVTFQVRIECI